MEIKRGVDPTLLAEYAKPVFYPCVLARLEWPGGDVRLHSGVGTISFNGETYTGAGDLAGLSVPDESLGYVPQEAILSFVSEYEALLADATQNAEGVLAQLFIGATTVPGGTTLVGIPYEAFTGSVSSDQLVPPVHGNDNEEIMSQPPHLEVGIQAGTHARVRGTHSHSDEDHQSEYPGDTLFERNARASAQRIVDNVW